MRAAPLTVIKDGINRLRTKGGARADSLYDLINAYVTEAKTVKGRPGTFREMILPSTTKGLVSFEGELHTFSAAFGVTVPSGYVVHVISHPDSDAEITIDISKIHFAKPYMGFLYVVAEFVGGDIYHFWLQGGSEWAANTVYRNGAVVQPSIPNGLAYKAIRTSSPFPSWAPNVPRTDGPPPEIIEPTIYNDFYYTVVETIGSNPTSGTTEPDWPEEEGARVFEDTEGVLGVEIDTTQPPATPQPDPGTSGRYNR